MKATKTDKNAPSDSVRRIVRWSDEDAERLEWLYVHGGDKACIPMRQIADELGRTEAACWAKLRSIFSHRKPFKANVKGHGSLPGAHPGNTQDHE